MVIDSQDIQYLVATKPAGAIAVVILSFAMIVLFARPVLAALVSAFAIIIKTTFPSVDIEPTMNIVHTVI